MEHSEAKKTARKMTIINIAILGGGLLLVFSMIPRGTAQKVKLEVYQCDHGRYTVLFPPDPVACSRLDQTEYGIVPFTCIQKDSPNFFYRAGYSDYPDQALKKLSAEEIFNKRVDDLAERSNGRILKGKTRDISVSGFPGRQYDVQGSDMSIRVRIITADKRLYEILVSCSDKNMKDDRINQILESFYIHK